MNRPFSKRYYRRPSHLVRDLRALMLDRGRIRALRTDELVDPAFRERLMLAVTEVNGCRYCAYAHAKMALTAGVDQEEIEALTSGDMKAAPPEQVPALLYAQHWADTDGDPDPEARGRVVETYGSQKTEAIELSLRMIRLGNLTGNTWDYVLYRISFGRRGG